LYWKLTWTKNFISTTIHFIFRIWNAYKSRLFSHIQILWKKLLQFWPIKTEFSKHNYEKWKSYETPQHD